MYLLLTHFCYRLNMALNELGKERYLGNPFVMKSFLSVYHNATAASPAGGTCTFGSNHFETIKIIKQ